MRDVDYPLRSQVQALPVESLWMLSEGLLIELLRRRISPVSFQGESYEAHKTALAEELLVASRRALPTLESLLEEISDEWHYIDKLYRFYHQSFKVFRLQDETLRICDALQDLMPNRKMNGFFRQVVNLGTGAEFKDEVNQVWISETLPITAAFFHAKFFLEMAVRCARTYEHVEFPLGSDLAAFLYLFDLR